MRENKGITLIALVITIIILLMLAGVSIAMLTGNNGILTQSKIAEEKTRIAKQQEEKDLDKMTSYINEKTIKDNYTDINGDKATIPEGFEVDKTENIISKGLVVHGPDKANGDNGSEFVWVPVPDINSMAQCTTAGGSCNLQLEDGIVKCKTHNDNEKIVGKLYVTNTESNSGDIPCTNYNANEGLREPAIITGFNEKDFDNNEEYNNNLFSFESLENDYIQMITSVAKYEGFYVGKYETSLSNATSNEAKDGKAQSKSGVIPTSAGNDATLMWYGLYAVQNKTYTGTNNSVESSMIWASQWDAVINWAKNGPDKEKITNTALGNNYSGTITITGNREYSNDSINNIRDLCGNLREWTLAGYNRTNRVYRGGHYNGAFSASYYSGNDSSLNYIGNGSRLALYIK